MSRQSRLRWRCRRGIKEMDLLLQRFLEDCYPLLSGSEKNNFEQLLNEADPDIMSWITGTSAPENPDYTVLINKLQNLKATPLQQ